ncbi:MAG: hypothetical protein IKE29_02025 [Paenibacillus sp.]|uniref:hypothetical protein n=1 Tax=Paenibacillus sp. TaxID=58172 RepID=UPI0025DC2965|nr:hypothetical protein [Paenibacillus sp.]MBR2563386.1 hypothetical protein [Paenibacillus sp.]
MMKLLLVTMFSVISPFSVQPAATPAAHDMQWTVMEEQMPVMKLATDHPETFEQFRTLNGVSLESGKHELFNKMGEPLDIKEDPYLGCPEYQFQNVHVGVCEDTDIIQYVHVDGSHDYLNLNGESIPMHIEPIHQALGEPYYVAEDGEVYIRGSYAIKVYMRPGSSEIEGVDLFDATVT